MKKETKRYYLVEYCTPKEITFNSLEEYKEKIKSMELYNKRKNSEYIFGNVTKQINEDGTVRAIFQRYNKLSSAMTISELDNYTLSIDYETFVDSLRKSGKLKTKDNFIPDINIAYYENKNSNNNERLYDRRIKYLPIMFMEDEKYLNQDFIFKALEYYAEIKDYGFFKELACEFCQHKPSEEEISYLFETIDRCQNQGYSSSNMSHEAIRLFRSLIVERTKGNIVLKDENGRNVISRRRLRDFAMFIKYYGTPKNKRKIPTKYNGKEIQNIKKLKKN